MTIQNFEIYTAKGYAGDLVDSGPRTIQSGVLVGTAAGFGKAVSRDTSVAKGVALGGEANVFAISQREYNHEAGTRPSTGEDTFYYASESVSLIRQGFLYVKLTGAVAVAAGEVLHVDSVTGEFSKTAVAGNVVATTNVTADEAGLAGEIIKVRIDIVA
jgi:hypothetical protein|tara:strand:- start:15234 stop:15710 length:477 start_codon:yes stop_codon:yes gene_type:complete